ncbi:MAG: response regulator, partial [Oscillospiraceae bacterium]|nr:response regulator [Oscillospiraceae bacterium]
AIRLSNHPKAKTIPIIAMTANAFADDINDAKNAGMNEHVSKPIDMNRLETVIKDILSKG